jgi:hypothetical protein
LEVVVGMILVGEMNKLEVVVTNMNSEIMHTLEVVVTNIVGRAVKHTLEVRWWL